MKIGLFGFTFGHENMGCQALTCAFLNMIQELAPNETIEIVDFHRENTLGIIPELFPNMNFKICHVKLKDLKFNYLKEVRSCDIVFDETYGDGFSDIYFGKDVYISIAVKYLCASTKTPYVFTPQTYGPFKRKLMEIMAGKAIRKAYRVYARDQISAEYAQAISGREVKKYTDLAFALPYNNQGKNDNAVGINISGLLWKGGFGNQTNQFGLVADYRAFVIELIKSFQRRGYEIHLISHVTKSADPQKESLDSDYPACLEVANMFSDIKVAPCFLDPYEAKNYISKMGLFIGARMHSTIAAFSSGVITIPFAYSRKFQGLYDNLGYNYYVDGTKESTEECVGKVLRWVDHPIELQEKQRLAMDEIQKNLDGFKSELRALVSNIR